MTPDGFRALALGLPEATESAHMGHADFRVRGKVFATLGYPDDDWAMVKLTPEQQAVLGQAEPAVFKPVNGAWGRKSTTNVWLETATSTSVRDALAMAWRNVAPATLVKKHGSLGA
jgi:hypothetical protein